MKKHGMSLLLATLFFSACSSQIQKTNETPTQLEVTLKGAFESDFLMGVALSQRQVMNQPAGILNVAKKHFNAATAENAMKWESIQPTEGQFQWADADALVNFTQQNNWHLTGHVLLWHNQTPEWVFKDASGNDAGRALVLERLQKHVSTYMARYKGKIPAWDVVNEALNEDGTLRQSNWLNAIGEDYIELVFAMAHEADPQAELIYNDYNLWKPEKRAGAIRIVRNLKKKGIPIHAVGMQAHYGLNHPKDHQDIEDSIIAFAKEGVKVHITELDLTVLPFPDEENQGADITIDMALQEKYNPFTEGITPESEAQFAAEYLNLFKIFLKHKDTIERVTLWGLNDGNSWRNGWPMRGRTDYPLLLDRNNQLKPAAHKIIEYAQSQK